MWLYFILIRIIMALHLKKQFSMIVLFVFSVGLFYNPVPVSAQSTLDCSTASNINVPIMECQALLNMYDNTDGENWYNNPGWDTDIDICSWRGISCTNIT